MASLDEMMSAYDPTIVKIAKGSLAKLRKRLRGATELVYDNYNALVVAFASTERRADIVLSIALYPRWVTLFFMHGARLPDPEERLEGDGAQIRGVRLIAGAKTLDEPAVQALIDAACEHATVALDPTRKRATIIQAVSAKQRPRRP